MRRSAVFSPCGKYRYELRRVWNVNLPLLVFFMLNPSTASAQVTDQTITKCCRFALDNGYGGIIVLNLYAYKTTYPTVLRDAMRKRVDVIGPENDKHILQVLECRPDVVCAWGAHARGYPRPRAILTTLRLYGVRTYALNVLNDGTPSHPLMLPYSCKLKEFTPWTSTSGLS